MSVGPVRPLRLPDTVATAGYDHLDPITQWFLAGSGTAGAEATGLNDDSRYGLDLLNVGSGGKALRATSGNGTYQLRVDNSGSIFFGGLTITGGALTVAGITSTNGFTVTTGATSLGGSLSVTGASSFVGAATFSAAATFVTAVTMNATLNVTGGVVFGSSLVVTGPASFITNVNIVQGLVVSQSTTIVGNLTTVGSVNVTGVATFVTNVVMQQGLNISQSGTVTGNWTVQGSLHVVGDGSEIDGTLIFNDEVSFNSSTTFGGELNLQGAVIDFDLGNGGGFTSASWDGYVQIKHDGSTKYVPYLSSAP